jgi:hypothetical protein
VNWKLGSRVKKSFRLGAFAEAAVDVTVRGIKSTLSSAKLVHPSGPVMAS